MADIKAEVKNTAELYNKRKALDLALSQIEKLFG